MELQKRVPDSEIVKYPAIVDLIKNKAADFLGAKGIDISKLNLEKQKTAEDVVGVYNQQIEKLISQGKIQREANQGLNESAFIQSLTEQLKSVKNFENSNLGDAQTIETFLQRTKAIREYTQS
jgi:hypothetical protein